MSHVVMRVGSEFEGDGWATLEASELRLESAESVDQLLEGTPPDCIVLDSSQTSVPLLSTCEALRQRLPTAPIIVAVQKHEIELAVRLLKAGVADLVARPLVGERLLRSVREAIGGRVVPPDGRPAQITLSGRERQVAALALIGLPTPAIAARLELSEHSVEVNRRRVLRKLSGGEPA